MTRKELRIMEIMTAQNTDYDVAERLFLDELEERYPDLSGDRPDWQQRGQFLLR